MRSASWLVNGLALFKTYGLFSFMFGVGLGFLMRLRRAAGGCRSEGSIGIA